MLNDVLYYTLSSGCVVLGAYGIIYIVNPTFTRDLTIHLSWESVNLYYKLKSNLSKYFDSNITDKKTDKKRR